MKKELEFNVSMVVQTVKAQQLLFYPLFIHLLLTALKRVEILNQPEVFPCYTVFNDDGSASSLWTPWTGDFSSFFEQYVSDCFKWHNCGQPYPKGLPDNNAIIISCLPPTNDVPLPPAEKFPRFYPGAIVTRRERMFLPLQIKAEDDVFVPYQKHFAAELQKLCFNPLAAL